jgi:hypothetical protein
MRIDEQRGWACVVRCAAPIRVRVAIEQYGWFISVCRLDADGGFIGVVDAHAKEKCRQIDAESRRVMQWQNMSFQAILWFFMRMSFRVAIVRDRATVPGTNGASLPVCAARGVPSMGRGKRQPMRTRRSGGAHHLDRRKVQS